MRWGESGGGWGDELMEGMDRYIDEIDQ